MKKADTITTPAAKAKHEPAHLPAHRKPAANAASAPDEEPPAPVDPEADHAENLKSAAELKKRQDALNKESSGPAEAIFVVESVLPTGSGRDTSTLVLKPDEAREENREFFRQISGRISLNDVRSEIADGFAAGDRVTVSFSKITKVE